MSDHVNVPMAFIGRKACGCLVAALVDDIMERPNHAARIGKELENWKAAGLTIERISCEEVRLQWRDCPHKKPEVAQGRLL